MKDLSKKETLGANGYAVSIQEQMLWLKGGKRLLQFLIDVPFLAGVRRRHTVYDAQRTSLRKSSCIL
jgi:hypothetical protein